MVGVGRVVVATAAVAAEGVGWEAAALGEVERAVVAAEVADLEGREEAAGVAVAQEQVYTEAAGVGEVRGGVGSAVVE